MNPDELSRLSNEVSALRAWTQTHDKAHVTDDDRLNMILDTVTSHSTNHHGTKSRIKESSLTILFFGAIAAFGQLVGLWEFFSRIPIPLF